MNPQRSAQVLGLFQTVVVAGGITAWLAGIGPDGIQNTSAAWIDEPRPPSLLPAAELTAAPRVAAVDHAEVVAAVAQWASEMTPAPKPLPLDKPVAAVAPTEPAQLQPPAAPVQVAAVSMPDPPLGVASDAPKPIVELAPTVPSQIQPPEAPTVQVATASTPDPLPSDPIKEAVGPKETPEPCTEGDACIDRYLWAIYQRTPKEDSIKVEEQRKVTVKKRGKTVTVTKTFTRVEDEDFAWKDPKAAERAGMPVMDYVVGGMDGGFKLRLFHLLRAAEEAGLAPGITSAFRDDYRQSIASGLKAASDRSYHGGSSRGAFGRRATGPIMAAARAAAMAMGLQPTSSASRARRGTSATRPAKPCGNGSMRMARRSELGAPIWIGIRRMSGRSTARNMPLTAARRPPTLSRLQRRTSRSQRGASTRRRNCRRPQEPRR